MKKENMKRFFLVIFFLFSLTIPIFIVRERTNTSSEAATGAATASGSATLQIMALGDSITAGYDSQTKTFGPGYRDNLSNRLATGGVANVIINRGYSSFTIQNLITPVSSTSGAIDDWMATDKPDIVLLDIGTNDARGIPDCSSGCPSNPIGVAAGKLSTLIDKILADSPTVIVVVAKLTYSSPQWPNINEQWYNPAVESTVNLHAKNFPNRVYLADMSRISNTYLADGYHPGVIGYNMMAYLWYIALKTGPLPNLLPPPNNPLSGQYPAHMWVSSYKNLSVSSW